AVVLLDEHPMVLILFRNMSLRYGDATKDQVRSGARNRIRLGQRYTWVVRLATWGADEDADVPASPRPHAADPTRKRLTRVRAHASVHDLRDRELGERVTCVDLGVDGG